MKTKYISALIGIWVLLYTAAVQATSVRPMNLLEMVEVADRVFWGKCLTNETKTDATTGISFVEYRFRVLRGLKGVKDGELLTFRQIYDMGQGRSPISGIPHYQKGHELLLFLHGDSKLGLTSPVGLAQGMFRPERLKGGEIGFINPVENKNLTDQFDSQLAVESGLTQNEFRYLHSGRPIPLNVLSKMIVKIERYHLLKKD